MEAILFPSPKWIKSRWNTSTMGSALLFSASPNRTWYSVFYACVMYMASKKYLGKTNQINRNLLDWAGCFIHLLPAGTSASVHGESSHQDGPRKGWWGESGESRHITGDYMLTLTCFYCSVCAARRGCAVRCHPSARWTQNGRHRTLRLWPAQQPSSRSRLPVHQAGLWGEDAVFEYIHWICVK